MLWGAEWFVFGAGVVGMCVSRYIGTRSAEPEVLVSSVESRSSVLAAVLTAVLTLLLWGVAMRTAPPFSQGQDLAFGFLIGGFTGALMYLAATRLRTRRTSGYFKVRCCALLESGFAGVSASSLVMVLFRTHPTDAMMGFAIGAIMASVLMFYSLLLRTEAFDASVLVWCFVCLITSSGTVLCANHFDSVNQRFLWSLPILTTASALVAALATVLALPRSLFDSNPGKGAGLAALLGGILTVVLSAVYAWRFGPKWELLEATALGAAVIGVCAWLAASALRSAEEKTAGLDVATFGVLLILGFVVAEFKLWSGLGIAIGLASALSVAVPVIALSRPPGSGEEFVRIYESFLGTALAFTLFRVFLALYQPAADKTDLHVHYSFVGAILGAIFPFALVSSMDRLGLISTFRKGAVGDLCALAVSAFLGFLAAAAPVVIYLVWQLKAVVGFMCGLSASLVFLLFVQLFEYSTGTGRPARSLADYSPIPMVLAAQLAGIQFVKSFIKFSPSRLIQFAVLGSAVLLGLVWFAVTSAAARRAVRQKEGDNANS
ncbi:MAG: hypothetical protein QHI38_01100 [Armatimonadota bacterium]|nr:hypothetical protein [Armatimonadota bacterium]